MPPKKFKLKVKRDRKAEAMARLRAYWEESHEGEEWCPEKEPIITPLLKAVEGGIPRVLEALRMHDDDDAQAFIDVYDNLSASDRIHLRTEDMAFACGIGSLRLAEVCQTAVFLYGKARTNLLLASHLPSVVEKSLKLAKTSKGVYDREMMLKAGKILPVPKGAQFTFNVPESEEKEEKADSVPAWRSSEDRLKEFQALTDPKRLPSPAGSPMSLGGHVDQLQAETVEILRGE